MYLCFVPYLDIYLSSLYGHDEEVHSQCLAHSSRTLRTLGPHHSMVDLLSTISKQPGHHPPHAPHMYFFVIVKKQLCFN